MRHLILLLILLSSIVLSQSEWSLEFTVEAPGTTIFIRSFGVAEGATDGYDILHDLPLLVSSSDTTVFFPLETGWVSALSRDIRNNRASGHQWLLRFRNMALSAVSWIPDSLPDEGEFHVSVHHTDSIPFLWWDMRITPMVIVPASRNVSFKWSVPSGEDTLSPYVSGWIPANGELFVPRETNIYCEIRDVGTGVDQSTIELKVGGANVTWLATIDSIADGFSVLYDPLLDFGWNSYVTCILSAYDLETPSNYVSDTVRWRTLPDSLAFEVSGTITTGDPPFPIAGAVVTISDRADTTGLDGYYHFDSISEGAYTIRATAPGYDQSSRWVWITSDTVFNFILSSAPSPEVLIIDFDSGSQPFDGDTTGEERKIASILSYLGYSYEITPQNPNIATLDLNAYKFLILVTPVRGSASHQIVPDAHLSMLADYLADDGRILWIAPDGGPDYAEGSLISADFFDMFGVVFESEGRAYDSSGNVRRLLGDASDYWLALDVEYDHLTPADNYLDELSARGENAYVALWSQSIDPAPESATGRMVFFDSGTYRCAIATFLFGGINDAIFPNSTFNILRAAMSYLDKPSEINDFPTVLPKTFSIRVFPNPFNSICTIETREGVQIFDLSGRLVAVKFPVNGRILWEGISDENTKLPTGIYLVRGVESGNTARAVLLK
jgi:hypothetical protein